MKHNEFGYEKMNKWQSVNWKKERFVINLACLKNQGMYRLHVKEQETLELPFGF